jgi:hypothetical protein
MGSFVTFSYVSAGWFGAFSCLLSSFLSPIPVGSFVTFSRWSVGSFVRFS